MDWLQLAEYLWLHASCGQRIFHETSAALAVRPSQESARQPAPETPSAQDTIPPRSEPVPQPDPPSARTFESSGHARADIPLAAEAPEATGEQRATPLRVGKPISLPGLREMTRALRPLHRRVSSGTDRELDIEASVERTAENGGHFDPMFRPTLQRWLELDLVVDASRTMEFWEDLPGDLEQLLNGASVFRHVRRWRLETDGALPQLTNSAGVPKSPLALARTEANRIVLVVTDTLGAAWHSLAAVRLLKACGRHRSVAVLHLLPPDLWRHTALWQTVPVRLSSRTPLQPNASAALGVEFPLALVPPPTDLPFPSLELDGPGFARWAHLLTARGGNTIRGFQFRADATALPPPQGADTISGNDADAAALVDDFIRRTADPLTIELACHLAAAPLVPAVMRLIQEAFAPTSRHWHLAAILFSGLASRSRLGGGRVWYEWRPGVQRKLLALGSSRTHAEIWRIAAHWLAEHEPAYRSFQAYFPHPEGQVRGRFHAESQYFAVFDAVLFQTWQGKWKAHGERLAAEQSCGRGGTWTSGLDEVSVIVTEGYLCRGGRARVWRADRDIYAGLIEKINFGEPGVFTAEGKMSTFGGPHDIGMTPSEGLALFDRADLANPKHAVLFLPTPPPGATGLGRRLNPDKFYIACRWNYSHTSREFLRKTAVLVKNPQNGKSTYARPVDWGPNVATGRVAHLSPSLAGFLGLEIDDDVFISISQSGGELGGAAPKERAELGQACAVVLEPPFELLPGDELLCWAPAVDVNSRELRAVALPRLVVLCHRVDVTTLDSTGLRKFLQIHFQVLVVTDDPTHDLNDDEAVVVIAGAQNALPVSPILIHRRQANKLPTCLVSLAGHQFPRSATLPKPRIIGKGLTLRDKQDILMDLGASPYDSRTFQNAKVVLLGESGAGKTSLALRLAGEPFVKMTSTHGLSIRPLEFPPDAKTDSGTREVWVWDLPAGPDSRVTNQFFLDRTALFLLVINPTRPKDLSTLGYWRQVIENSSPPGQARLQVVTTHGGLAIDRHLFAEIERLAGFQRGQMSLMVSPRDEGGVERIRSAISKLIPWQEMPVRATSAQFLQLKQAAIRLREGTKAIFRRSEFYDLLRRAVPEEYSSEVLEGVAGLLANEGLLMLLPFGDFVLLRPELMDTYTSGLMHVARKDPSQVPTIPMSLIEKTTLSFKEAAKLSAEEKRVLLLASAESFVACGLAWRVETASGTMLIFHTTSSPLTERPKRPFRSAVSYRFKGPCDRIHSTLVVQLHYSRLFGETKLNPTGATFLTDSRTSMELLMWQEVGEACLELHFGRGFDLRTQETVVQLVHAELNNSGSEIIARSRGEICPACGRAYADSETESETESRPPTVGLGSGSSCPVCGSPIETGARSRRSSATSQPDGASEGATGPTTFTDDRLSGQVMAIVSDARQIFRAWPVRGDWVNGEIEFQPAPGETLGPRYRVALQAGEAHMSTRRSAKYFRLRGGQLSSWARDDMPPVLLIVRTNDGRLLFTNATDAIRAVKKPSPGMSILLGEEKFTVEVVRHLRNLRLAESTKPA